MVPLLLVLVLAAPQDRTEPTQEKPRVPKDSIELTVIGCLKGRSLTTVENRQADVESGPYIGARTFRLAGKRAVMDEVKRQDRHLVEIVGIVKRSDLDEQGVKVGRVTIGPGSPASGTRSIPSPADNVPVMDVESVRMRAESCRN
ncbi:MAG TPA: hypothetical protein VFJ02_17515 [Vicinamibacterales bacterium]|nr:hypothetical protein [Vicinamibacterales bacterium]